LIAAQNLRGNRGMKGVSKEVCYLVASTLGIVDQSGSYEQGWRVVLERFELQDSARVLPVFSTVLKDLRSCNSICQNVCTNISSDGFNLFQYLLSRQGVGKQSILGLVQ